jgi:transcriptional regulator with XRE-family HTH domain
MTVDPSLELTIIRNIRRIMQQAALTQRSLAHAIDMPEGMLSKVLSEEKRYRRHMKATELADIAKALNVSVDYLLSGGKLDSEGSEDR